MTSNTHFHETAALYMTLLEMQSFGAKYAAQVVANTKALAKELTARNFKLLCADLDFSNTHEVIVDLEGMSGAEATRMLDAANIFVNPQDLPSDTPQKEATGLRLGTQVLTRRGFKEADMASVAHAMHEILHSIKTAAVVRDKVAQKCSTFGSTTSYTF